MPQLKICWTCGSKDLNPECLICNRYKFIYQAIENLKRQSWLDNDWELTKKEIRFLKNAQKNRCLNPMEIEYLNSIFRKCTGNGLIATSLPLLPIKNPRRSEYGLMRVIVWGDYQTFDD